MLVAICHDNAGHAGALSLCNFYHVHKHDAGKVFITNDELADQWYPASLFAAVEVDESVYGNLRRAYRALASLMPIKTDDEPNYPRRG